MKKNNVLVPVSPEFRDLIKIEAKTKGLSIPKYTEKILNKDIECLAKDWDKKYKKVKPKRGFDFL